LDLKKKEPAMENIHHYSKDFGGNLSDKECIKLIGISRNTYYKYKKELREEEDEGYPNGLRIFLICT